LAELLRGARRPDKAVDVCLPAAVADSFKNSLTGLPWKKSVAIYQPLFLGACHLASRAGSLGRAEPVKTVAASLTRAAGLAAWAERDANDVAMLLAWREHFRQKSRNPASRRRIDAFWRLLAQTWRELYWFREEKYRDLLSQLEEAGQENS
jgi:hypothetical protein